LTDWKDRIAYKGRWPFKRLVIKGTGVEIEEIRKLVAENYSKAEIMSKYPKLTLEDVDAALSYLSYVAADLTNSNNLF
jgi:uncharacterized protein (DUF433 family)